jgi:hypothetical protein
MRKTVVAFTLICAAVCAFAQDSALKVGSIVAARWDDGSWYRGKITAIKNGKLTVGYDDGDSLTLERSAIKLISPSPKVSKGQEVFALWEEDGLFYLGTVSEVRKTAILFAWDDGGQSASIPFGMFTTDVAGLAGQPVAASASPGAKSFVLWHKGSRVGEVESNGRVWIGGTAAGEIEPGGRVWKGGSVVGEIGADGRIWEGGSQTGEVDADGRVWRNGSMVGEAPGLRLPWAAAVYFFFFIDE